MAVIYLDRRRPIRVNKYDRVTDMPDINSLATYAAYRKPYTTQPFIRTTIGAYSPFVSRFHVDYTLLRIYFRNIIDNLVMFWAQKNDIAVGIYFLCVIRFATSWAITFSRYYVCLHTNNDVRTDALDLFDELLPTP